MTPLVSIIIPCFNDGKYLSEAVHSAQKQTYPATEIIIVNDHSTDPLTCKALEEAVASGLRVLHVHEGKKGLPAARNVGINAAAGEFILPLDADDKLAPTYIEKAVTAFSQNPRLGICYCRAHCFGLKRGPWKLPDYSFERILSGNMIFATALFPKALWQEVGGYDENLYLGMEDYALWLQITSREYEVHRLEETLFFYRIKKNSLVAKRADEKFGLQALRAVFNSCRNIYEQNSWLLLKQISSERQKQQALDCLFSWKIFRHICALEWKLRQKVKKIVGRA